MVSGVVGGGLISRTDLSLTELIYGIFLIKGLDFGPRDLSRKELRNIKIFYKGIGGFLLIGSCCWI